MWLKSYSGVGGRLLWEIRLSGSEPTPLAVGDMNKDGIADVLYAARSANSRGTLFVHDGRDGALLHATPIGRRITSRPTVAPPVKGLGPLVGVGSWGRSFTLLDGAGKEVWENQSTTGWILQPGAVGDMDGDGRREVVFGATDRRLRVVARDGASWDYLTPGALQAPPLLRDLDWDGRLEVVVGFSDGTLRAIRGAEPRARADQSAGVTKRPEQLIFGAPAYLDPAKLQEIYRPLMAYLTRELGLPCSLRVVPYRQVIMDLAGGRSQVAVLSPLSYVLARRRVPGLRLVASHLAASKSSFRGVVVVRDDSPYWRLADLRGKRIAYVDPDSTSGCLYPQAHLLSSGSDPRRFFDKVMFGQTHNGGVRLLLAGKVDAAATFGDALGSAAYHGNKTANLRVIDRTEPIPYDAYVARPEVPPDLVQALSNAFLRLNINTKEGRKILGRAMRIDGWLPPDDRRYDGVRRVLKLLERHGVR